MTKSIKSKSLSKLFIHEPLMKVFSYERVIYVLFCNSCIFCLLHLFLTNILLESWNFLTIFFIEPCMIRADDLVLSTYKCTYNGSMRWPSTNKMNSVFSNDSSSSLFFYFSVVVINENYKRSKLVNLKTRGCHYAALVQFQLKM